MAMLAFASMGSLNGSDRKSETENHNKKVMIDKFIIINNGYEDRADRKVYREFWAKENQEVQRILSPQVQPIIEPIKIESYLSSLISEETPVSIDEFEIIKPIKLPRHIVVKEKILARPNARVSPQHWVYKHFADLVKAGHIRNVPVFFFMGGKTFNRGELSTYLKDMVESIIKGDRVPAPDNRVKIQQLLAEFSPELKKMKTDVYLGYKEIHSIKDAYLKKKMKKSENQWAVSGSSTTGYTDEYEKHNTNWNNTFVLNINKKKTLFNMGLTTNQVNREETPAGLREVEVGSSSLLTLDKYSLEDERAFFNQPHKVTSVLGFTPGASFSEGLTVGNMSLEGASFNVASSETDAFDLLLGHTQGQDADKLLAIHYSEKVKENMVLHGQVTGALYDDNSTSGSAGKQDDLLMGIGVELMVMRAQVKHESVFHKTRSSHYVRATRVFAEKIELSSELRYYDGVDFEYNSLDVYAGISGGDEIVDRGFAIEGDWEIKPKLNYIFNFDTTFNGPFGDFIYFYQELAIQNNLANVNLSYEREWASLGYNHISTMRLSRDWIDSLKTTMDWSRENVDFVGSDSVRLSGVYDAIKDILSFSLSYSNRNSDTGSDITKQFGINWSQSLTHFFSLQMSVSDPDATGNNVELNYLYKF
jgi:hypothetical protein